MAKITPRKDKETVVVSTKDKKDKPKKAFKWWEAKTKEEAAAQLLDTASFLKEQQQYRYRQAGIFGRLYGNQPIFNFAGSGLTKQNLASNLPIDRPTMNVVQSCVDTLNSRVTQSKPRPIFLTDNGNYKQRNLAKQLNNFILGELYQTKAYKKAKQMLLDAEVLGTGCLKVYEDADRRVALDRVLLTELLVDQNEAYMGEPRQMYQFKLVDRSVVADLFPKSRSDIEKAEQAYPDNSGDSQKTASDQIMLVEGWRLPSSKEAKDGRHMIACSSGYILDEPWTKEDFPFVFLSYGKRLTGFWGQGLAEQLMGTQVEINKLLITISQAINLVGVPRVFVETGSKVVKAHLNNNIGAIVEYQGTKPQYEVAPCIPQEVYAQLQRLVEYAYQQSGVSALSAAAQKPAGLNSGEAIRNYDDLQTDRFSSLVKDFDNVFIDLSYQMIHLGSEIAERDGKYQTIYPNKNGVQEIDLPKADLLSENPWVIQCFDSSSLPRDPAGRMQTIIERIQAGMMDPDTGRRLMGELDIESSDALSNAAQNRILKYLDEIVEEGKYNPPDPFMPIDVAEKLVTQYYNLYVASKLEEDRAQMLRDFFMQVQSLKQAAMPQAPMGIPQPQAVPEARPTSPLIPNTPMAV
jgi:hypothetical protein